LGGTGDSSILRDVINEGTLKGVLFVAAAGNDGGTAPNYPAAYPGVTSVTAVENGQLPSYADRGPWVSFAAPGTSTIYYNNQPWSVVGTSSSAAYVSGALAGYLDSTHSSLDQAQSFIRNNFSLTGPTPPGR